VLVTLLLHVVETLRKGIVPLAELSHTVLTAPVSLSFDDPQATTLPSAALTSLAKTSTAMPRITR
jgi:hypothetical protein